MKSAFRAQINMHKELDWEPSICGPKIGATMENDVVTLTSTTKSFVNKWTAEHAIDGIQVELPTNHVRNDTDIATAAPQELA
jgi:hypothetical protein